MKKLLSVLFVFILFAGCKSMPTLVPVEEIKTATDLSDKTVVAVKTVLEKATELNMTVEALAVPEEVKTQARDLVQLAKESADISEKTQKAINELKPIVENIAKERNKALESEKTALAQNHVLLSIITRVGVATGLILLVLGVFLTQKLCAKIKF